MEFLIKAGQRFICDAEPELGLGMVTEVDQRTLTIEFPAVATTRQYAIDNSPLTRIRFDAGDTIQDQHGTEFTVIEAEEVQGTLLYRVSHKQHDHIEQLAEQDLSALLSLSQPLKRLFAAQTESAAWFALRRSALAVLSRIESSPLLGLYSGRTELLPHQLYIAHEVAQRPRPRVLLSDEVGLGKTIEACLILQQQLFNGLASRVLILVPETLLHQWLVELLRRFNLRFTILDQERCEALTEHEAVNPFESDQLILCSRNFLSSNDRWQQEALQSNWDLLILDEAHHLLATSEQSEGNQALYQMASKFAETVAGMLLLTATPDQAGLASHFALLQLLDPHRFHDYLAFVSEQQRFHELAALLDPLLIFETLESQARSQLLQKLHEFAADAELQQELAVLGKGQAEALAVQKEKVLQALLDRHGTGRIVFRNTRKHISGFPERKLLLQALELPELYQTHPESLHPELAWLEQPQWLKSDPRIAYVHQLLRTHSGSKFLLICHSSATAQALEAFLRLQRGVRSAVFHEGLSLIERDRAAAYFAEPEAGAQILVCSEIGSEGRNFQFSSHLILFDLPINPDLLEQRIGRLDRIGQQHAVSLHVPYFSHSAQSIQLQLYDQVFDIFTQPNPVAAQVCEQLADLLGATYAKSQDAASVNQLLQQARELTQQQLAQHARGRDRLLELNSCRPAAAQQLLREIRQDEKQASPAEFLQAVFASYGLDFDINYNRTWNVRPGEDMLISHFPQVPDEGLTFTLDRSLALQRDDLPFVNWLHPLVQQSLDLILQDHKGKVCVAVLKDKRFASGTLIMESLNRVIVSAPSYLQAKRWFPATTLRAVVDSGKRSVGKLLSTESIDQHSTMLEKSHIRLLLDDRKNTITLLHRLSGQVINKQLPELVQKCTTQMQHSLETEIARLTALQQVNPQVKSTEIEFLQQQKSLLTEHYSKARAQTEALRLLLVI